MSVASNLLVLATFAFFGLVSSPAPSYESTIRQMVAYAMRRLNQGDLTAIDEFCDENADYVGIDGQFIQGRPAMRGFFAQLLKTGDGTRGCNH